MRICNLNPACDVGASSWLVELDGHRLLLDAGTHPKREGRASLPLYERAPEGPIDAIAISHCHHDHVGSLPIAAQRFPTAHLLMTELSYRLAERVLHNSVNVMVRQREELGVREYPLYSHDEVDALARRLQGFRCGREIEWAAPQRRRTGLPSPTLALHDAGHTLGAAGVMVRGRRETLFYTGDVSFRNQTLLKGARFEGIRADVLLIETTRGNRHVPAGFSRETETERLAEAIRKALKRKGAILIPAFALGRTQEILGLLALLMRSGRLGRQAVYIGGLGRAFTEVYDTEAHRTHRQHGHLRLHEALNLVVLERSDLDRMRLTGGRLFVLTSGMMAENTPAHDLALRLMGEERHAIFFVGYADPETPGGRLKASRPGERFAFSRTGGDAVRRCVLEEFDLTAHANRDELLDFVGQVAPRAVVLGHGEPPAQAWFEAAIRERFPRLKVLRPGPGEIVEPLDHV